MDNHFSFPGASVRLFSSYDTLELVNVINQAYKYQDIAKGAPRTNPKHLQARAMEVNLYVVIVENDIVGCVYTEPKGSSLHFGLLTLAPEHRGTGLSQALIAAIESYAHANKYKAIELDYMSLAPWLKPYYEKYGFEETGEIEPWGSINLVRMKKHLHD